MLKKETVSDTFIKNAEVETTERKLAIKRNTDEKLRKLF